MDLDLLRIGDAERERAAADLGEHYAQGRLTADEHAERLDRIWAARTRGELGPVFSDLPGPANPASPASPASSASPARVRRRGRPPAFPFLPVLVVLVALAVVTHAPWLLLLPVLAFVLVRRAMWSRRMR